MMLSTKKPREQGFFYIEILRGNSIGNSMGNFTGRFYKTIFHAKGTGRIKTIRLCRRRARNAARHPQDQPHRLVPVFHAAAIRFRRTLFNRRAVFQRSQSSLDIVFRLFNILDTGCRD